MFLNFKIFNWKLTFKFKNVWLKTWDKSSNLKDRSFKKITLIHWTILMMTWFLVIKLKLKFKMIKMDFKMNKIITNLMTKTWIKATKTFNFNPKKIIATSLLETIQLKKISGKVKRKKINFLLLKKKISQRMIKKNHSKKPNKPPKEPIMLVSISALKAWKWMSKRNDERL